MLRPRNMCTLDGSAHSRPELHHAISLACPHAEAVVDKDRDAVFAAAGAITSGKAEAAGDTSDSTCMICMDDIATPSDGLTMSCGHTFCKTCWLGHFLVVIGEGRACNISCMACQVRRDLQSTVRPLTPDTCMSSMTCW